MDKKTRDIRLNAARRVKAEAETALAKAQERQSKAEKAVTKADRQIEWLQSAPLDDEDEDEATEPDATETPDEGTSDPADAAEETAVPDEAATPDEGSQGFLDEDAPAETPAPSRSRRSRAASAE